MIEKETKQQVCQQESLEADQSGFFEKWAGGATTDSLKAATEYDCLSEVYENQVAQWNYKCHEVAAELMKKFVAVQEKILDLGCGTGLAGEAFHRQGYRRIAGADISKKSLDIARKKNLYTELHQVDLQERLPFRDNAFDAISCTAVMTYIETPEKVLHEFSRIVKSGGYILFTNRTDIHAERQYPAILQRMEEQGVLKPAHLSPPMPYMPDNPDYTDKIKIFYCMYKIL